MAILKGTSMSRFPDFNDPNAGTGLLLSRAQTATQRFLEKSKDLFRSSFVEDGAEPVPASSLLNPSFASLKQPTRRTVITQKPKATIFIKKRMFSTLSNNFDVRFMDEEEKLFLRAAKLLFSRKCDEIAFYENLLNLEGVTDGDGFLEIDRFLDEYVDSFFQVLDLGFGVGGVDGINSLVNSTLALASSSGGQFVTDSVEAINKLVKLREINQRSRSNQFTTWIVDSKNYDFAGLGPGTGVIELNLVSSLNTTTTIKTGKGSCSLSIEDPYRLLLVNEADIEIAIRSAASLFSGVAQAMKEGGNLLIRQSEFLDKDVNASRAARNVSAINFELGFNEVRSSGIIVETQERFTAATIDNVSAFQALNPVEKAKAIQVLSALDQYVSQQVLAFSTFGLVSADLTPLRKRMRKEFLGQSIIQHMDAVHVFMNSDTRVDTPNYTGSATEKLNSLQNKIDSLSSKAMHDEWEVIGKGGIPFPLYQAIRKPDVFRGDGVSTFAGLVNNVQFNYSASDGKFEVKVTAQDNIKFLEISRFNTQPSLLQSEGILEDPLTPFDLNTDLSTGLLTEAPEFSEENKKRLKLLRFSEGPNTGDLVRDGKKLWTDQDTVSGKNIMSFQHTPGLIYKWKEGIVSASMNVNSRQRPDGSGSGLEALQNFYGIPIVKNPFSGLDAADIMSILTTGQPYNYAAFLQSSIDSGSFSLDNNSQFFFNFLFDFLERQRSVYGKFIPAKKSVIDPRVAIQAFEAKRQLDGKFKQFLRLQKNLAQLQDTASLATKSNSAAGSDISSAAKNSIGRLRGQIEKVKRSIANIKDSDNLSGLPENIQINIEGNRTQINIDEGNIGSINNELAYRLKRKPEQVRYNEDNNFFIVSDKYDYDTDIQAFTRQLKNTPAKLFQEQGSDYKNSLSICEDVANKIDFEFFADTQGNIVFRPPEYNKTPLTLLVKMLRLDSGDGSSIAPAFLLDLFKSRVELVKEELGDRELRLKEKALLGGFDLQSFGINSMLVSEENAVGTNEIIDIFKLESEVAKAENPDNARTIVDQFEATVDTTRVVSLGRGFTIEESDVELGEGALKAAFPRRDPDRFSNRQAINLIKVRKQIGARVGNIAFTKLDPNSEEDISAAQKEIDSFSSNARKASLVNDITKEISERQFLLRTYGKLEDQHRGFGQFIDKDNEDYGKRDLFQNLLSWSLNAASTVNPNILPQMPKFMQDLIENDLSNDDGWRSGKRFIINDDVILDMSLQIAEPDFNRINITGNIDFVGENISSKVPEQFWAGGTDFDSWRQFGHRSTQDVTRPDFSDAETQLAPYAVFKLLQQRRKIHSGSITVVGNEFYQPGDVVYINNKSMLYYVEDVSHSLNFNDAKFRTQLKLSYGHTLGDYIPTPLDVIGKGLLANKRQAFAEIRSLRNSVPPENHVIELGTLFVPSYDKLGNINQEDNFKKSFIEFNLKEIQNIATRASSKINAVDENSQGIIEVRSYFITQEESRSRSSSTVTDPQAPRSRSSSTVSTPEGFSTITASFVANAELIGGWTRDLLINGSKDPLVDDEGNSINLKTLPAKQVDKLRVIDIASDLVPDDKIFRRFPSAKAWSGATTANIVAEVSGNQVPTPINAIDVVFVIKKKRSGDK